MKLMRRVACMLLVLGMFLNGAVGDETQEDDFKTEVHENGDEEEITILDKNGQVVGTVDMFEDEGYQIDKPTDGEEHVCLLRKIDEMSEEANETDGCYKRSLLQLEEALEMNMSRILDHCGNRTIYILEPQDCDRMYTTETAQCAPGNLLSSYGVRRPKLPYEHCGCHVSHRERRSWPRGNYCCHYKTYKSVRCVRQVSTSRCCVKLFFICLYRCKTCVTYSTRYITELLCHYG